MLLDRGLVWAEGSTHKRQRKALAPAFGLSESKSLIPRFLLVANKVRARGIIPMAALSPFMLLSDLNG